MRNERKYTIISLLTFVLAIILVGSCVREPFRMNSAEARQHDEYVIKGAATYALNCVQCHGPRGEGVVGMPLNRSVFKVDYQTPAGRQQYDMIIQTVRQGRKGNDLHFQWEKQADGNWLSYTTMPSWGRDFGGPLDDDYVKALALFIMNPTGEQWNIVGDPDLAPFQDPSYEKGKDGQFPLPDPVGVDAETTAAAKALLNNLTKSQCLTCHTIGTSGSKIGPDLTHVGSWGLDQKFIEDWIKYANVPQANAQDKTPALAHDKRMPVYWSANRASASPAVNLKDQIKSEGPYFMPRFQGKLTDQEITTLARYLLGLK
ncbi:MAG TPA: c-type cytochrome [Symbiobacteriaceae bacterium]|nr:c-type cytochrome [Symbiobacteriaceae bacterium]